MSSEDTAAGSAGGGGISIQTDRTIKLYDFRRPDIDRDQDGRIRHAFLRAREI